MDIMDLIHKDHGHIRDLMLEFSLLEGEFEERRRAFARLAATVSAMSRAENAVVMLHSLSISEPGDELRARSLKALEEHDLAETLARACLTEPPVREEVWNARASLFLDLVERHLDEEEHELIPEIFERWTEDERVDLGHRYVKALKTSRMLELSRRSLRIETGEQLERAPAFARVSE